MQYKRIQWINHEMQETYIQGYGTIWNWLPQGSLTNYQDMPFEEQSLSSSVSKPFSLLIKHAGHFAWPNET